MGVALALGEYTELTHSARSRLVRFVKEEFQSHPDAGIHSAMEWLANTHGFADELVSPSDPNPKRTWQTIENGHTMVKVSAPRRLSLETTQGDEVPQSAHTQTEQISQSSPF